MELNRWHLHLAASAAKLLASETRQSFSFLFFFLFFFFFFPSPLQTSKHSATASRSIAIILLFFNGALGHIDNAVMRHCAEIKEHQQESDCISRISKKVSDEGPAISNSHARVPWTRIRIRKGREMDDSRP